MHTLVERNGERMILVDPVAASADSLEAEAASANAIAPSGIQYALTLVRGGGTPVTDPAALQEGSIVRILVGPLAGRIGLFCRPVAGEAVVAVVAPELKKRRRYHNIRIETGLRAYKKGGGPHLDPKVGDLVWARMSDGGCGPCRVCSVNATTATVCWDNERVESVDLCTGPPRLELLVAPSISDANGRTSPLPPKLVLPMADYLLELLNGVT